VGILIEHFSDREHTILDPMCGSGIVGVVNELKYHRKCYLGDLNPNSQLVCDSLLKFFKERLK
jgi:DNA modification methylase